MFLKKRFFIILFSIAALAAFGVLMAIFYKIALVGLCIFVGATIADMVMLIRLRIEGGRDIASKLDLGEENSIKFDMKVTRGILKSGYIIDEIPSEFITEAEIHEVKKSRDGFACSYQFFPSRRGNFNLGRTLLFASVLGLLERRIVLTDKGQEVDVYPAFTRLREKEEQVRSKQVLSTGSHKRQLPSNQTEFRDIREYVVGDDIRTINWKATARAGRTMVNNYEEERSQHIFNIIDCGRTMHRTFNSLTLQDYSINASLLLSYTALGSEGDCVGLVTYGPMGIKFLPPRSGDKQLKTITQQLYALQTQYGEGDIEEMCLLLDRKVARRSLVILYTDYATVTAMQRQLPFLSRIARRHRLVVVNFIDHELHQIYSNNQTTIHQDSQTTNYTERSIATDLIHQKHLIADKLQQSGINCVMIRPEDLSFSIVRKYLELKSRGAW